MLFINILHISWLCYALFLEQYGYKLGTSSVVVVYNFITFGGNKSTFEMLSKPVRFH